MSKFKHSRADVAFRHLLKELRLAKGLTQAELAKRLSVPQSYVSKYETGERRLDFPETAVVCDVMGLQLNHFVRLFERRRRLDTAGDTVRVSGGRE
jgi:transcriptional regulator with XRE-family HTH domain